MKVLEYKVFKKAIDALKDDSTFFDDAYKIGFNVFEMVKSQDVLVNVLEFIFDDEDKWISHFCWELDFGKEYKEGDITERVNGKTVNIKLETVDDLYKLLIKNMESKN